MKPQKSILDPTFEYVDSVKTDIRKRFYRERKRLARLTEQTDGKVLPLTQRRKA